MTIFRFEDEVLVALLLVFAAGAVAGFTAAALYARKRYAKQRKALAASRLAEATVPDLLDALYLMPSAAGINYEDFDDD
jgi:hypothetical protein